VIDVALLSVIRRWHHRDGISIRKIARRTGLSRNTVRKYLASGVVEPQYPKHKGNSKLDEYANTLTSWLHRESHRKRKQRLSVKQLFYNLVQLGYTGSYDRVAAFARDWLLFLDGEYVDRPDGTTRFRWVRAPTSEALTQLAHTIASRVGRYLERQGLLVRDAEYSYLASDGVDEDPMSELLGHAITYRIAVGPQAGRKVFTLQTLPACDPEDAFGDSVGKVAGFSLHAGVAAKAHERKKLERLCRYVSRPAVSEKRLSLTPNGNIRYQLKTPYRDGTTHVIFEPPDFIARLAALVPKPRVNLTRFHGVFAPNSQHRARVTPAKRGKGNKTKAWDEPQTPAERRTSMTWAQRLKRVFNIDIDTCRECGGAVKVIACIEDALVIKKILTHLRGKELCVDAAGLPRSRAPPQDDLFS